jgi:hypothetical protein
VLNEANQTVAALPRLQPGASQKTAMRAAPGTGGPTVAGSAGRRWGEARELPRRGR